MIRRRQIADRIFGAALSLYFCAAAVYGTETALHGILRSGGIPAMVCIAVLAGLAIAAAADTVINDVMPARYSWRCGVRYRQGLWMWIAVTDIGIAWVAARFPEGGWVAGLFVLCAARAVWVAVMDLWHEHVERLASIGVDTGPVTGRATYPGDRRLGEERRHA